VTVQGDIKTVHLKPPIVVRDFATALGLKPFKLISELMEMGIFASMNQNIEEPVAVKVAEKHGFLLEIKHRGDAAVQQAAKDKEKENPPEPYALLSGACFDGRGFRLPGARVLTELTSEPTVKW